MCNQKVELKFANEGKKLAIELEGMDEKKTQEILTYLTNKFYGIPEPVTIEEAYNQSKVSPYIEIPELKERVGKIEKELKEKSQTNKLITTEDKGGNEAAATLAVEEDEETQTDEKNHLGNPLNTRVYDGKVCYQTFYICPQCNHKGKRYVSRGSKYTFCHECNNRLIVRRATQEKELTYDKFGNYYVAGCYLAEGENLEEVQANERFLSYSSN